MLTGIRSRSQFLEPPDEGAATIRLGHDGAMRFFNCIRHFRTIATRYDKCPETSSSPFGRGRGIPGFLDKQDGHQGCHPMPSEDEEFVQTKRL